jgi:FdhE protein
MTSSSLLDAATIGKAAALLAKSRPAYASILSFYGPVFSAQAKAAANTPPPVIPVDEATVEMKLREGFSLIAPPDFTIDDRAAGLLLVEICNIAAVSGEKLAGAGKALAEVGETARKDLFRDVLKDKGHIEVMAQKTAVAPDMLFLLLHLAIRPSIEAGAQQLADHLPEDLTHRNNCPICGSAPIIGELDADGSQWLHCSLCWYRWAAARMVCLFCGNRSSDSLEYLYSEEEPEYRVYLCKACKHYLKVVDTRKLTRVFFAALEQVVSLHLDMTAAEKGLIHAMGSGTAIP